MPQPPDTSRRSASASGTAGTAGKRRAAAKPARAPSRAGLIAGVVALVLAGVTAAGAATGRLDLGALTTRQDAPDAADAAERAATAAKSYDVRRGASIGKLPLSPAQQARRLRNRLENLQPPLPVQRRPEPITVAGDTTAWQPGVPYRGIFADPDIVRDEGRWLAYSTNTSNQHLPTLVSDDLVTWRPITDSAGNRYDPLPQVGSWVMGSDGGGGLWAPGVAKVGDNWIAAYSAQQSTMGGQRHNCIGLSVAERPGGPFTQLGDPLECAPESQLGVIDPDIYVDEDGRAWMMWKFSGVVNQRPAGIFVRELNPEGTGYADGSQTRELLTLAGGWEGDTIENPSMIEFRGVHYLFYSANAYTSEAYATGYAICSGPTGPCRRPTDQPFLNSAIAGHLGPGGAAAFNDNGALRLIYHAWEPGQVNRLRSMRIASLYQRDDGTLELIHPG